jgi:hypothetical protein
MLARISAICAALLLVCVAGAQDFFHRPSPFAGSFMISLATFPEVQKELKLTPDDSKKIDELLGKVQEDIGAAFQDSNGDFGKLQIAIGKINVKADGDYLKTLTADQSKRLKELFVQFTGAGIIVREDFAKDLALTDEQKAQVTKLQGEEGKKIGDLISSGGGDPASMAPEMKKLNDQFKLDLTGVLHDDQKKKLDEMKGSAFEFQKPAAAGG